jgi:hypothetical protein
MGFAFWWLLVLSYAYFISSTPNFNTESHLYTAFAIVDHHTVSIDAYQTRLGDKSYSNGHFYSDKAPGVALLAVPVYAALELGFPGHKGQAYRAVGKHKYTIARTTAYMRYAITYVLLIIPSAIFSVLLWLFLCRFMTRAWAMALAAAYALGTIAFPYSSWLFSHQITAMLLFGAFLALYAQTKDRPSSRRTLWLTCLAGLLAGYSVIGEYPTILIAALLGLYAMAIAGSRWRAAVAFAAGMIPAALINIGYNVIAFGKPFSTGYMYVSSNLYKSHIHGNGLGLTNPLSYGVQAPTLNSLFQITLSSYRGLFFYCPVLLLFFAGCCFMWRRRELRPELLLCGAVVLTYFLMVASRPENQNGWAGGWSIASRHLTPVLPFMILPMAFGFYVPAFRRIFVVLAALSMAIMFSIMASAYGGGLPYGDHNPMGNAVWAHLRRGTIDVNWGWLLGLRGPISLVPYVVIAGLLVVRIVWLFRNGTESVQSSRPVESIHLGLETTT